MDNKNSMRMPPLAEAYSLSVAIVEQLTATSNKKKVKRRASACTGLGL